MTTLDEEQMAELMVPTDQIAAEVPRFVPGPSAVLPCLAERLRRVMHAIGGVAKEGTYSAGNVSYKFRGVEQIAPRVRDAMIDNGVICLPVRAILEVAERDPVTRDNKPPTISVRAEVNIRYRFINCDNPADTLDVEMVASAVDSGDKYVTKALTSAFKYLMLQSFCIGDATDDQDRYDADRDSGEHTQSIPQEWDADDDEIAELRAATAMLNDVSKVSFAAWWKNTKIGSLREGHVNGRYVPAALALVQTLLDQETAEDERDADALRT